MGRCNFWCDCFQGFDPFTYFCIIGFTMSIFSLVLGIIDLVYYVYYLSGAIPGTQASIYFLYFAVTVYVGTSIKNCCLCCIIYDENPEKDFDTYNGLAFMSIMFAIIDGFLKLSFSILTSIVFFSYAILGTYFLILTCQSRDEVSSGRRRPIQVESGAVASHPVSQRDAPGFPAPVDVEQIEVQNLK